jgi:histidinol-phosphate aminotransferase
MSGPAGDIRVGSGGAGGVRAEPAAHVVDLLDSNENALGPSPSALAAMARAISQAHCYPDNGSRLLRGELARRCRVDAGQIFCGAGSNEIIRLAAEVFTPPGRHALAPRHSFRMLKLRASQLGRGYVETATVDFQPDIDDLIAGVGPDTGLVYVATPGNPAGDLLTAHDLGRLCDAVSPPAVVVIDEAYADYTGEDLADSPGVRLADARPNVICLRTFSKIFGLAGLRVGWSVSSAALAGRLEAMRGPYNVSVPAQHAALAALDDTDFTDAVKRHCDTWRARVMACFSAAGRRAFDTPTNFVLAQMRSPAEASDLCAFLARDGIGVKHLFDYELPDCIRITIGPAPAMERLVGSLERFFRRPESQWPAG